MAGMMIQTTFGRVGAFEAVVPNAEGAFSYYWRDNDDPRLPWHGPRGFGKRHITGSCVIESGIQTNGRNHLEVVACEGNHLVQYWRDGTGVWNGPFMIDSGVQGTPALIQSRFGDTETPSPLGDEAVVGNFEIVVPRVEGGLAHYWRNTKHMTPWQGPFRFGKGNLEGAALFQSGQGSGQGLDRGPGFFEVFACDGNQLVHYTREDRWPFAWSGPEIIANGVRGTPTAIQSNFETSNDRPEPFYVNGEGQYHVIVPNAETNGLSHFFQNRHGGTGAWQPGPFPSFAQEQFNIVSLTQSNFTVGNGSSGGRGNFEVLGLNDFGFMFYWREDVPPWAWNGRFVGGLA